MGEGGKCVMLHLLLGYEHKEKNAATGKGKLLRTVVVVVLTVQTAGPIIQSTELPVERRKKKNTQAFEVVNESTLFNLLRSHR